jgi:hypothetical protein
MAGKFHLLEGVSSIPELFENPALADRRQAFEDYGGFVPPTVATRMDEAPCCTDSSTCPPALSRSAMPST